MKWNTRKNYSVFFQKISCLIRWLDVFTTWFHNLLITIGKLSFHENRWKTGIFYGWKKDFITFAQDGIMVFFINNPHFKLSYPQTCQWIFSFCFSKHVETCLWWGSSSCQPVDGSSTKLGPMTLITFADHIILRSDIPNQSPPQQKCSD